MTARDFAFRILRQWSVPHDPPMLPERGDAQWQQVPARDRAFALDVITGVIRWRNLLDAVIAARLKGPLELLDPPVRAVLWIGAYQLLLQSGTADYAAVDSTVTLARKFRETCKAGGLVNAVLRGITRQTPRRVAVDRSKSAVARLSRRRFAIDFAVEIEFAEELFPDVVSDLTSHLAAVRSHTSLYVDHLRRLCGDSMAADLLLRNNQRPVVTLRADAAALDVPAAAGLVAHAEAARFLVAAAGWNDVIETLVKKGTLSPQDPTAAKPVRRVAELVAAAKLKPPRRILDLCAGLGTKTIQLARAFPEAAVMAADIDAGKLDKLMARVKQIGVMNVTRAAADIVDAGTMKKGQLFDLVLVDVPCSNTGVMAKRVQSRWRWPALDRAALEALQLKLFEQAAGLTAAGGTIVYATCSIDPAENEDLVRKFLAGRGDQMKMVAEERTMPSLGGDAVQDGGYFAVVVRG